MFDLKDNKNREQVEQSKLDMERNNSVDAAKNVAKIVSEGVKSQSYVGISKQLEELSNSIDDRMTYVFKECNYSSMYLVIILCAFLGIAFLFNLIIGLGIIIYSSAYFTYGMIGSVVSLIIVLFNTYLIKHSVDKIKFLKRYAGYEQILRYHNIELIDDLAEKFDIKTSIVVKDLYKAIKLKLIPQGHMGRDDLIIMVSDEMYDRYKEKQVVYDRYYRKLMEERMRCRDRSEEIQRIMETGQVYIDKIHEGNNLIEDEEVSRLLVQMEKVVSRIFYEVDRNPSQAEKLGVFLNYYLPTTEKLLKSYIEIDTNETRKETSKRLRAEIVNSISSLNQAFEGILDKFYQEQEMDLLGDIAAMEVMMKQEGIAPYDI